MRALARLSSVPGVSRVGLALVEGGGRRLLFTASDRIADPVEWCDIDAYDDVPLTVVTRRGAPVVGLLEDLEPRFAAFADLKRREGCVAVAAVPLVSGEQVLGAFVLFFDRPPRLDAAGLAEFDALGHELELTIPGVGRSPGVAGPNRRSREDSSGRSAALEVPIDLAAVAAARRALRDILIAWGVARDQVDDATVCLSEMVTNALIHARTGCRVFIELRGQVLRIEVQDAAHGVAREASETEDLGVHGRGLRIIESLADRTGHDRDDASGWFEFDL